VTDYEQILYEVTDPVATITLNRPQQLNAWTQTMEVEVRHAVGRAVADPAVVGIVLTGAGRGFCAGADLNTLRSIDGGTIGDAAAPMGGADVPFPGEASWGDDLRGTYTYLLSVPKPIVAAINGPVAGMGVPIALCCDLRFMADDAVLTTSFTERGLVAEWGIAWLLPRLVGSAHALDLLFSARKIKGPEAAQMGVVNRSLPTDQVLDVARAYITDVAARCSPASMAIMKRQVYQQLHAGLGAAEQEAQQLMVESFGRPDFGEGLRAFFEKRPPQFGRIGAAE
jgi:enoyl-CoA hydratase/carnithine racemase